jgi:hypothetical protein
MTFDGSFFQRSIPIEQGKKYRVTWKMANQRQMREFVGVFLGTNTNGDYSFSMRPVSGTSDLSPKWIVQCLAVPDNTPVGIVKP